MLAGGARLCKNICDVIRRAAVDDLSWDERIFQLIDPGVDGTLIAENLRRTPTERLRRMQEMARFLAARGVTDVQRLLDALTTAGVDFVVVGAWPSCSVVLPGDARSRPLLRA